MSKISSHNPRDHRQTGERIQASGSERALGDGPLGNRTFGRYHIQMASAEYISVQPINNEAGSDLAGMCSFMLCKPGGL